MKKWKKKLAQLMLYGGLKKEEYQLIASDINEANRKSIVILSCACALIYAIRLFMGFGTAKMPHVNKIIFLTGGILFSALAVINGHVRQNRRVVHGSAYLFMAIYLGTGILASIGAGSLQERTTLYLVFIAVVPMLFALNAVELTAVVASAEIIYLILITRYQSAYPVYSVNRSNSIFFAVTGLLLGIYMANMKMTGIYNAYMNSRMEEIRRLNEELRQSKKELQQALVQAESANHAKTIFLNNMSHDIRTPMNAIIGFTSLAETHLDNKEQVRGYLGKIMTSSRHLLSLINDVLDMSRIESGTVKIETKPLYLPDLMDDIRTISQQGAEEKQIRFSVLEEHTVPELVWADRLRLSRVLINVIGNAVKFTPEGGSISVRMIRKSEAPSGYSDYEFKIKDNGSGMSKEFQQHIFEAFSRENTEAVSRTQGTGLGMAITKNLVDRMGGEIHVASEEGKGTEFTISLRFQICGEYLPQDTVKNGTLSAGSGVRNTAAETEGEDEANGSKSTEAADEVSDSLRGKRILLVEDNELNREIAEEILREHGVQVETAKNGKEAVGMVRGASGSGYDLILMDIQMPAMNGYEAARAIRRLNDPQKAAIPILAMTANAFEEDRKAAEEAGMNGYLAKPFDIGQLVEAVEKEMRK